MNTQKAIGILGGMGPLATCDLMEKIIRHTEADRDQEYIHLYVDCNTSIPDRTAAILHGGDDPLPELVKSAVRLQTMGADVLVMPCNTAHYFRGQIQPFVDIPLLDMPRETAKYLRSIGVRKAAVLATDGTRRCGIYDAALKEAGIGAVYPNEEEQALVMSLIYECVKAGKNCPVPERVHAMAARLQEQGAEVLILGCTELPIAFAQLGMQVPVADATEILACAAVRFAGGALRQ